MNTQSTTHLKLGIFVTVGFLLFAVALYFISAKEQFFSSTFRVSGVFADVSGLQAGNNVRFSGVTVGLVESITIESDSTVRVDMLINDNTRRFIKKDAEAAIGTEGLMGNKIVVITPGTSSMPAIEDKDRITTRPPLDFDLMLHTLKSTNDNVEHITGDLADIVHTIRRGKGTIGQLLMDSTYLEKARDNVTQITNDVAEISGTLRSGKSSLGKVLMDSTYLTKPIDNAIRLTGDLGDVMASVRSGKGAAGKLLMDSATAATLDTTLNNLKQGSYDLKQVLKAARSSFLLWGF